MINWRQARKFCSEDPALIENYDRALENKDEVWDIHHRRETDDGISRKELKERGEYWQRPAFELIFLKHGEHTVLHHLGTKLGRETKKKLSLAKSGENHPLFGKHHSDETKRKMSEALSGEKNPLFGTRWYNNGLKNVRAKKCPPGFHPGCVRCRKSPRAAQERGEGQA